MGKIRTRVIGNEEEEKKQKEEQKARSVEKKAKKVKSTSVKITDVEESHSVPLSETSKGQEKTKGAKKTTRKNKSGKKYQEAKKMIDKKKLYTLSDAISLLKKIKYTKFDESVELHFNLNEDGLKGEVELPHSTGKTVRVKIVDDAVLAEIEKGTIEFDILITHPSFMPRLAKFAKVLGPKGLMPNPKAGTISPKPEEVAKKFNKGMLRWKSEAKFPLLHQMIGKISFEEKALLENAQAFFKAVGKNKIVSAFMKTSMSPSVRLDLEKME